MCTELVPDLYGEVIGWVNDEDMQSGVVNYLASIAGVRDDWGVAMSLAFSGGYEMGRFLDVWERSGEESRRYLINALGRRKDVNWDMFFVEVVNRDHLCLMKLCVDIGFMDGIVDLVRFSCICMMKLLLRMGFGVHSSDFYWASTYGYIDVVKLSMVCCDSYYSCDDEDFPLEAAYSEAKVAKFMVDVGADVHTNDNITLIRAADYGRIDVVRVLMRFGADVDADDGEAVMRATESGYDNVVRLLLGVGKDTNDNIEAISWVVGHDLLEAIAMIRGEF